MLESVNLVKNHRRTTRWNKFFGCFGATDTPCFCWAASPDHHRRKASTNKSFSSSLKALLFRTPFVKKSRDKKHKWGSCRPNRSYSSSKPGKQTQSTKKKSSSHNVIFQLDELSRDLSSNRSSLLSSASGRSTSSFSSNSTLETERICGSVTSLDPRQTSITNNRHQQGTKTGYGNCNINYNPICILLLICLVALIFWGKAVAIVVCTSSCLFTAPAGGVADTQTMNVVDSKEYKKRVIMEGLLKRSRPH